MYCPAVLLENCWKLSLAGSFPLFLLFNFLVEKLCDSRIHYSYHLAPPILQWVVGPFLPSPLLRSLGIFVFRAMFFLQMLRLWWLWHLWASYVWSLMTDMLCIVLKYAPRQSIWEVFHFLFISVIDHCLVSGVIKGQPCRWTILFFTFHHVTILLEVLSTIWIQKRNSTIGRFLLKSIYSCKYVWRYWYTCVYLNFFS